MYFYWHFKTVSSWKVLCLSSLRIEKAVFFLFFSHLDCFCLLWACTFHLSVSQWTQTNFWLLFLYVLVAWNKLKPYVHLCSQAQTLIYKFGAPWLVKPLCQLNGFSSNNLYWQIPFMWWLWWGEVAGEGKGGGGAEEVEQWESGVTQVILSVKPHKSAWFTFQVLRQSLLFFLVLMFILLIPPQAGYYSSEVHPILPYGQTIIFLMGRGEGGGAANLGHEIFFSSSGFALFCFGGQKPVKGLFNIKKAGPE